MKNLLWHEARWHVPLDHCVRVMALITKPEACSGVIEAKNCVRGDQVS